MAPRNDVEVRFGANTQAVRSEVQRMIGFTRASLASLGVGLSVGAIANEMRKAVDGLKEVSKEAKTAGVAFEAFQELSYAAKRNLVSVEALTDGLKEMQLRADEFAKTGKGSAAEAFARLGYDAKSVAQALREPDAMFEEIIEKLQRFDKAAQIRIADEVFGGTAGEQFVRLLDESRGSIADLRKEARDLGIIIDDDLRKRVDELDKAWGVVVDTVGQRLHKVILQAIADLGSFLDQLREVENRTTGTLNQNLADDGKQRLEIEKEILRIQDMIRGEGVLPGVVEMGKTRIKELRAEIDALAKSEERVLDELERRRPPSAPKLPAAEDAPLADPKVASEIERQRKAVLELIDALAFENEIIGKSEEQKRVDTALRKAGTAATEEQRQKIEALVRANYAKEQAVKAATKADQDAKKTMEEQGRIADRLNDQMLSSLEGLATRSLTAKEALIQVGFAALKALLDVQKLGQGLGGLGGGGGGIGGLLVSAFGGLLGGGFKPNTTLGGFLGVPSYDGGGKTGSGPRAGGLDGKGGFLALLHPNEGVDDYTKQIADPRAVAGGLTSSPGVTVSIQIPIDATGADSAAIARLEAGLAETNRTLPARVVSTVQQAINSRVIR